mmetsp:Transcript_1715/g.4989  ORF Transcript_1715/g.4989 Transcript_1715/m.4989 type:complete len:229 (+) Transcript_1715:1249-1935(+)
MEDGTRKAATLHGLVVEEGVPANDRKSTSSDHDRAGQVSLVAAEFVARERQPAVLSRIHRRRVAAAGVCARVVGEGTFAHRGPGVGDGNAGEADALVVGELHVAHRRLGALLNVDHCPVSDRHVIHGARDGDLASLHEEQHRLLVARPQKVALVGHAQLHALEVAGVAPLVVHHGGTSIDEDAAVLEARVCTGALDAEGLEAHQLTCALHLDDARTAAGATALGLDLQ